MKQKILFENAVMVTGVQHNTVPSGEIFAAKGEPVELGVQPWNFEKYTGKEDGAAVLVRTFITIPQSGWYLAGSGADFRLSIWIDGIRHIEYTGEQYPTVADHRFFVKLTAGKHTLDFNFARGVTADMVLALEWCGEERTFGADLEKQEGLLNKELHGSNTTLSLACRNTGAKYADALRKLNFTLTRTHDWALWNGGQRIIDTHFIFPLMKLDPEDPSNYYFAPTDEIIRMTQDDGKMEVFYRLGTSIEHTGRPHFNIVPPADFNKYAEVLAGIVRHYVRGWANGFFYKIRYWEIWNEPDGSNTMWDAPFETFIPFFVTVLKRLKSEFPELKFGGPAITGSAVEKFRALLGACREAGVAPDFISWHSYGWDLDYFIFQPLKMRYFLDDFGFPETKLCINEWHYLEDSGFQKLDSENVKIYQEALAAVQGINSAVYNTALLSSWQYGPLDMAMWYGASWESPTWGYSFNRRYTKNYFSMELYGRFLKEYTVKCHADSKDSVYLLAGISGDGQKAGILISDFKGTDTELEIPVRGIEKYSRFSAVILDETRDNESVPVTVRNGALILRKSGPGSAAFMVSLEK